jgi:hypothetical protein
LLGSIELRRRCDHCGQDLVLQAQLFVLVAQWSTWGGESVDLGQPLAQQEFEAADSTIPIFYLAAQAADRA